MIDIINDNFNDLAKDYYELQEEYEQLQQENKQLKEKLEYLRSNEYLNQVKWERNFNEELVKDLQQRIDKAIEYIQKRFEINEYGEYYFTHTFDNSNMKELLEILGDKENE